MRNRTGACPGKTNVRSVEYLGEAARKTDARIVHISSDYVFDGTKTPYPENAAPNPLNYYGRTKLVPQMRCEVPASIIAYSRSVFYGIEIHEKPLCDECHFEVSKERAVRRLQRSLCCADINR